MMDDAIEFRQAASQKAVQRLLAVDGARGQPFWDVKSLACCKMQRAAGGFQVSRPLPGDHLET